MSNKLEKFILYKNDNYNIEENNKSLTCHHYEYNDLYTNDTDINKEHINDSMELACDKYDELENT